MAQNSLTDGLQFDNKKASKPKTSEGSELPIGKLAFVAGAFILAGFGIAYSMGAFDARTTKPVVTVPPPDPEVKAAKEKAKAEEDRLMNLPKGDKRRPIISGS